MRKRLALAVFISVASLPTLVLAEEIAETSPPTKGLLPIPDYSGDFWQRMALSGDWGGARKQIAEKGVQFDVDWTQYAQTIVSGGREKDKAYGGHVDLLINFDLMRMGVLPGGLITVRAESRYGASVNGNAGPLLPVNTTAFFPVTNIDEGVELYITDLRYTQFLGEHFGFIVGKLDTLDADLNEFASGRGKSQFMDANFLFNTALALRLPYSTLGAGIVVMPNKYITFTSSIVNTTDSSSTTGFEGFGKGYSWSSELDVQYRVFDLPGGMNFGALYSFAQDFANLNGRIVFQPGQGLALQQAKDTWAFYWSGWQYLYVADPDDKPINLGNGMPDHTGFGLFTRFGVSDPDTNPFRWSGSLGLGGRGLIPTRDNDIYGIGYFYTRIGESRITGLLPVSDEAQGLEAFYNVAITPAAHLTFDVQVHKTADPNTDCTVILGMRLNLSF